jgi:hypothetical protein
MDKPRGRHRQLGAVEAGPPREAITCAAGPEEAVACNHAGGPLHQGKLEGKIVTCPWHGSQWDVTNGNLVWFQRPLPNEPVYKVLLEGDEVFVEK